MVGVPYLMSGRLTEAMRCRSRFLKLVIYGRKRRPECTSTSGDSASSKYPACINTCSDGWNIETE